MKQPAPQNTAAEVRAHGKDHELIAVELLDRHGRLGPASRCHTVRLEFTDGRVFRLAPKQFSKLDGFAFKLHPPGAT